MALGPQFNKENVAQVMENYIDTVIQGSRENTSITINVSNIPSWNRSVFEAILCAKYRNVGWRTVEYHSDWRDGNFIWLKA